MDRVEAVRLANLLASIQSSIQHAERSLATFQGHRAEALAKLERLAEYQPGNLVWVVDRLNRTAALAQVVDFKPVVTRAKDGTPDVYFTYLVEFDRDKTTGSFTQEDLFAYKPGRTD